MQCILAVTFDIRNNNVSGNSGVHQSSFTKLIASVIARTTLEIICRLLPLARPRGAPSKHGTLDKDPTHLTWPS